MRRYIEIYSIMLRNSLIRELSFKANFLLWMVVEVLWFCGQIVFFSIIFANVDRIGDWTKWEVVLLIGTHQMIAQLFQAFFFVNVANIPELVRTGKLDSLLVLPIVFEGRRRAGVQIAVEFLDPDGHHLEIYWGLDRVGADGLVRPKGEWREAHTLEDALENPPPGQSVHLDDPSLIDGR